MPIILKETKAPPIPAGTYPAVCYGAVFTGTQPDTGFGPNPKLVLLWELPYETLEIDGKVMPKGVSHIYNLGSSGGMNKKSALRKDLARWRNRDFTKEELERFEIKNILGKPCQLCIVHNDEGRHKVDTVMAFPKGASAPPVVNTLVDYDAVTEGKSPTYAMLPEWLRKMCDACLEWNGGAPAKPAAELPPPEEPEMDTPF